MSREALVAELEALGFPSYLAMALVEDGLKSIDELRTKAWEGHRNLRSRIKTAPGIGPAGLARVEAYRRSLGLDT